jgi:hypothetical protein
MTVTVEAGSTGRAGVPSGRSGPSIRLGGRFRLDERMTGASGPGSLAAGGIALWKATDEVLHRPVTVHVLPGGEPVPGHVVTALQAAARVNDPRLATVYDTDFAAQVPYIVSEWAPGTHLEDLVLSGLPRPALAAAMIADAADALAVAHKADRPHLRLGPRSLRWDTRSGLKITGLGIEAALFAADQPAASADAGAADTMALGRMLYALLTGFWPGHETTAIPAAPRNKGRVYTPRQVRAGVPGVLDAITCYALQLQPPGAAAPTLTPAGLAMALHSVQRPSYSPFRLVDSAGGTAVSAQYAGSGRRAWHGKTPRTRGARHRTTLVRPAA